jgi:hypothetical protein
MRWQGVRVQAGCGKGRVDRPLLVVQFLQLYFESRTYVRAIKPHSQEWLCYSNLLRRCFLHAVKPRRAVIFMIPRKCGRLAVDFYIRINRVTRSEVMPGSVANPASGHFSDRPCVIYFRALHKETSGSSQDHKCNFNGRSNRKRSTVSAGT